MGKIHVFGKRLNVSNSLYSGYTKEQLRNRQVVKELRRQVGNNCPPKIVSCDAGAKYRTANGSCNNLENPTWGMANIAQARVVEAAYGISVFIQNLTHTIGGEQNFSFTYVFSNDIISFRFSEDASKANLPGSVLYFCEHSDIHLISRSPLFVFGVPRVAQW